jgi:hypothetical protein
MDEEKIEATTGADRPDGAREPPDDRRPMLTLIVKEVKKGGGVRKMKPTNEKTVSRYEEYRLYALCALKGQIAWLSNLDETSSAGEVKHSCDIAKLINDLAHCMLSHTASL